MVRSDRFFKKLDLTYRSQLNEWYKQHLWETYEGFEDTRHVLWTHKCNEHGYPIHKPYGYNRWMPLNGYLLYKNEGFFLSPDETIRTACGITTCQQTAHFRVYPRAQK